MSARARGGLRAGAIALGLVLGLALAAVAWVQLRQQRLLGETVRYQDEYLQISLNQLQAEYLRLRHLVHDRHDAEGLDTKALQLRYDIFVSRVDLLDSGRTANLVAGVVEYGEVLTSVQGFVARADRMLGPKPSRAVDDAGLRELERDMAALDAPIQSLVLAASHAVAARVGERYDALQQHNRWAIALTLLLSLCSVGFALFALSQLWRLDQRRRALETLAAELHVARGAAESANLAKTSFLANMSHEIRTPFQGLLGMMQLLDTERLEPMQRRQLHVARESAQHLLAILNDMLDISRLETGTLALNVEPVTLRHLVADVRALMAPPAADKGLVLEARLDPVVPERVLLDDTRVRQVLFNLLSNAIKFTERGGVSIDVGVRDAELVFAVADTGVGIDERTLPRLFKRFSQGDDSTSRRFGGTGLGLEISRGLARLMGGDLSVTSAAGAGSRFEMRLPLQAAPDDASALTEIAPALAQAAADARRLRLLVAEDNEVNREVLAAMIDHGGHEAQFANDGRQAVAAARADRFDLVLMDLHMPEMDGIDATRAIRALPGAPGQVPIIALTADAFAETRARCLAAGMNDFLSKPVSADALLGLLAHWGQATAKQPIAN